LNLDSFSEIQQDEIYSDGILNLIAAMFRLVAQDIRLGRKEAEEFLYTEWFETICDGLQVDPSMMRECILNNKIRSRVTYE